VRFAAVTTALLLFAMLVSPAAALAHDGLQIMKSADVESVTAPGGDVTYTYVLTNTTGPDAFPSETPTASAIGTITVTDDKLGDLTLESGDDNSNQQLDPGENWQYTARASLTETTTNVGTVTGTRDVDGVEVSDSSTVTVGMAAAESTTTTTTGAAIPTTATPWYNVLVAGGVLILLGTAGAFVAVRRIDA
jgi:hypothetical protein